MKKVKILADSVCDILNYDNDTEGYKKFDIDYIPLYVRIDRDTRKDYKEILPRDLYKHVEEVGQLPQTSCPSPDDFYQFFKKYTDEGYDVVYFSIGSNLSGAVKSAQLGAEQIENGKVFVIDSQNISTGEGIQVVHACKLRDEGKSAEEIATICNSRTLKSRCKFVVDNMDYLHKGGRCNSMTAFVGSLLKIKPVITVENGKLSIFKIALGKKKGLLEMLNAFKKDFEAGKIEDEIVFVTHSEIFEEAEFLKRKLVEMGVKEEIIHYSEANCTVATHCGPKCIGIIYNVK